MGKKVTHGGRMKITRKQLRKLINETVFASGPTVDDQYPLGSKKGIALDMGRQHTSPRYRKQWDRDEEIRKTADPRIVDLLDTDPDMARVMAGTFDGKPDDGGSLTPEETQYQSLFDEFEDSDDDYDVSDDRLQSDYSPAIQQLKDLMKRRVEEDMSMGITDYEDLYNTAYTTPGYQNLRRSLMKKSKGEQSGMADSHVRDDPRDELSYMPQQILSMLDVKEEDYY